MEAAELAVLVNRLHYEEERLNFPSMVLAEAFDFLHASMFAEKLPEEERWMSDLAVNTVERDAKQREGGADLFPAPRPPL